MLILICAFGGLRRCRSGCSFNLHDRSAAQDAWLRLLCRRQVGLASDKAQYIHRLGRTARAGKSGKGMLLLGDFEERFLNSLQELSIDQAASLPQSALNEAEAQVQRGLAKVDEEDKAQVSAVPTCHHPCCCNMRQLPSAPDPVNDPSHLRSAFWQRCQIECSLSCCSEPGAAW